MLQGRKPPLALWWVETEKTWGAGGLAGCVGLTLRQRAPEKRCGGEKWPLLWKCWLERKVDPLRLNVGQSLKVTATGTLERIMLYVEPVLN